MFLLDGKRLPQDTPFEYNGVQYPANWLNLSTPEEKTAIGITEVAEQFRPDDRYYWVTDNGDGTFTATPKDLDQLKANANTQIDVAAHSLLSPSDYMTIKAIETGAEMSTDWKTWRQEIRTLAANTKSAIGASSDVDSLLSAITVTWPKDPVANTAQG
jgi:hypothetical protein